MKQKIKLYISGFIFGAICFYVGVALTGIIILITGFYNKLFLFGFGVFFAILLFFKFENMWTNFFHSKKPSNVQGLKNQFKGGSS